MIDAPRGGGGGGTSGTVTRFDSGPLRPRAEVPNTTYVRIVTAGNGPSSGPFPSVADGAGGAFLSGGTAAGVSIPGVSGSCTRATTP